MTIGSTSEESANAAIEALQGLIREPEIGEIYTGKVTRIMEFGAFVEIMPGKEGLVHISQLAEHHVDKVEDEVTVGDEVTVMLVEGGQDGKDQPFSSCRLRRRSSGARRREAAGRGTPFRRRPLPGWRQRPRRLWRPARGLLPGRRRQRAGRARTKAGRPESRTKTLLERFEEWRCE